MLLIGFSCRLTLKSLTESSHYQVAYYALL
jgi:hypothetical protein